ncbi:unnamed protein product [Caenorhabditis nigoni]
MLAFCYKLEKEAKIVLYEQENVLLIIQTFKLGLIFHFSTRRLDGKIQVPEYVEQFGIINQSRTALLIVGQRHLLPCVPQEAVQMKFQNDQMEFDHPQDAPADEQHHVEQEMHEPIENVEEEEEEDVEQLILFDVIDRNTPQDIESDLQPYLEDLVGFTDIGYARKSEIAKNKRHLDADIESLILPFNCFLNYLGWSKEQVQEFFCQIFPPENIRKLVEKVSAGCVLCMFQETEKSYFKRLNKRGSIIDWDQFLTICQEIDKIERFKS